MMMQRQRFVVLLLLCLAMLNCADDQPFLSGFIRRASDAVMTPCDPYNKGVLHTCLVFSSAFNQSLIIYDATVEELVLAPMLYFPLKVKVGPATNDLVTVKNVEQEFPYFLALDPAQASLYVVRAFGNADKSERSFQMPLKQALPQRSSKPYKMEAWANDTHVIVVVTYPNEAEIEIVGLHKATGLLDPAVRQTLTVGVKPSHVAMTKEGTAIISDEGSQNIHELAVKDLSKPVVVSSHHIGMQSDRLYVQERDFGQGTNTYVALLEAMGLELKLYNFTNKKAEASLMLKGHPRAAYFPDAGSASCCEGEKHWLAVIDEKGLLKHIAIKTEAGALSLKEVLSADLTSEKNLSLTQLSVIKIVGGAVIFDPFLEREKSCPNANNRKMFFISSFALDKPYYLESFIGDQEAPEIEAQGQSCEGDGTASLFGTIDPEKRSTQRQAHLDK